MKFGAMRRASSASLDWDSMMDTSWALRASVRRMALSWFSWFI